MYIYGSECTATLILNSKHTPLPYSFETLREEREEVALDPLVGYIFPISYVPSGTGEPLILGCLVTRVCAGSLKPLASLLLVGFNSTFLLHLNRIVEQRIYSNLRLTCWEVRSERDEALFIRLDMKGREARDWDYTTENLPWEQKETLTFTDGNIVFDGGSSRNIYTFALTRLCGVGLSTILQIHYPLLEGDVLNNERFFNVITLTFNGYLRFTLTRASLLSFIANTDNAEEILVVRRFRIDGDCCIEICDAQGVWVSPL